MSKLMSIAVYQSQLANQKQKRRKIDKIQARLFWHPGICQLWRSKKIPTATTNKILTHRHTELKIVSMTKFSYLNYGEF